MHAEEVHFSARARAIARARIVCAHGLPQPRQRIEWRVPRGSQICAVLEIEQPEGARARVCLATRPHGRDRNLLGPQVVFERHRKGDRPARRLQLESLLVCGVTVGDELHDELP
eukprot:scaffold12269_cov45-Phaeocystis_antarctica.AAC.1